MTQDLSRQSFLGAKSDATLAGITVATLAVPQAMAYAMLAGLPPQYGLYTAIVMTAVGALLDSSRLLINGPTNAISIALLSALLIVPERERLAAGIAMAFMVGGVQIGIALLHLGDLTRFVASTEEPTSLGFTNVSIVTATAGVSASPRDGG